MLFGASPSIWTVEHSFHSSRPFLSSALVFLPVMRRYPRQSVTQFRLKLEPRLGPVI